MPLSPNSNNVLFNVTESIFVPSNSDTQETSNINTSPINNYQVETPTSPQASNSSNNLSPFNPSGLQLPPINTSSVLPSSFNPDLLVSNVLGNLSTINPFVDYQYNEISSNNNYLSDLEAGLLHTIKKKKRKINKKNNIFTFNFSNKGRKVNKINI